MSGKIGKENDNQGKKKWNEVLIISRSMGLDVSVPTQWHWEQSVLIFLRLS